MTDFTIKNLKGDIDDSAPKFGLAPDVEARFAREDIDAEKLGLSYQHLEPNVRQTFGHKHANQEEVYVILAGGGRVKLDDEIRDVTQWDAVRVAHDTIRCFEAGTDGLTLLAVGAPFKDSNDVEMIQDWWSD